MLSVASTIRFAAILSASSVALAANDFTTACQGSCGYESGDGVNTAWGSIILDGPPELISDISPAAGWETIGCSALSVEAQEIRIVCTQPDKGCKNLFLGEVVNTIVRLPEGCAEAPFARIATFGEDADDQSVPTEIEAVISQLPERPKVMEIKFDFEFASIPEDKGEVTFTSLATTNPLQRSLTDVNTLRRTLRRRSLLLPRDAPLNDLFSSFVENNRIEKQSEGGARINALSLGNWDKDWSKEFDLINLNQNFPILDHSIQCKLADNLDIQARVKADADVNVQVTLTVGFAIAGSIIPPKVSRIAFTTALEGEAAVTFNINADAKGVFDTGLLPLYEAGLPGVNIPGIISVGPKFGVYGQAVAELRAVAEAHVTAAYTLPKLQFVFPKDQGDSNVDAKDAPRENPLKLTVGGSADLTGKVAAHIKPRVEIGVSVLSGAAKAAVYLELDGYSVLDMNLSLHPPTLSTEIPIGPVKGAPTQVASSETSSIIIETTSEDPVEPTSEASAEPTSEATPEDPAEPTISESVSIPTTEEVPLPTTSSTPAPECSSTYVSGGADTCASLEAKFNLVPGSILAANSFLKCDDIWIFTPICIPAGAELPTAPECSETYISAFGDTCASLETKFNLISGSIFAANSFLDCEDIWVYTPICVPTGAKLPASECTTTYTSITGDTCESLEAKFNLAAGSILAANDFLNCEDIWVYTPICVPASTPSTYKAHSRREEDSIFSGCIGVDFGLGITAGVEGKFFNLWEDGIKWDIYSQKWDVFDRCFGVGSASAKRDTLAKREFDFVRHNMRRTTEFVCPSFGELDLEHIVI